MLAGSPRAIRLAILTAILAGAGLGACGSGGTESSPPTSMTCGALNLTPRPPAVTTVTVHFKNSATKAEMASFANQLDAALGSTTFSDLPSIDFCYEERLFVISWSSRDAARRGEGRIRELAGVVAFVETVEVTGG